MMSLKCESKQQKSCTIKESEKKLRKLTNCLQKMTMHLCIWFIPSCLLDMQYEFRLIMDKVLPGGNPIK